MGRPAREMRSAAAFSACHKAAHCSPVGERSCIWWLRGGSRKRAKLALFPTFYKPRANKLALFGGSHLVSGGRQKPQAAAWLTLADHNGSPLTVCGTNGPS